MKKTFLSLFSLVVTAYQSTAYCEGKQTNNQTLQQQLAELQRSVEQLTVVVSAQQKKIQELESSSNLPALAPVQQGSSSGPPSTPVRPSGSYLPDIGVVVDIVGTSTEQSGSEEGNDQLSLREAEFVFGHDIDPYSRMDVVATFSDQEGPDIEEANITYWGLPGGIKARVGRMRQRIGKATATHRDALETVDEPFVVQRYLGIEGLFRTGLELSAFTPFSLDTYTQELVLGGMQGGVGDEGELFGDVARRPSGYAHLANFYEISDVSSFEMGGTYLIGSQSEESNGDVQAFGVDLTYLHHFSPTNMLKLLGELYAQDRRDSSMTGEEGELIPTNQNPFGAYLLADYRLAERWGIGARYDYVEPTRDVEGEKSSEVGYSAYLTFFQSEFARWRFQYQRASLLNGDDDNRIFLQGTFAIGAHKHNLN